MSADPAYYSKLQKQAKGIWTRIFKDALDADSWGQSIEATEEYEKLSRTIEQQMPELGLSSEERSIVLKLKGSVDLRVHTLMGVEADVGGGRSDNGSKKQIKLEEMKQVQLALDALFVRPANHISFPANVTVSSFAIEQKQSADVFIANDDSLDKEERTHLPPPQVSAGQTSISLAIEKIGLKDAETYIDAQLTVSLVDSTGKVIESQNTARTNNLRPSYVIFPAGTVIHIQTPWEEIQAKGYTLFFEFKHYKPKKKKVSTRCFALMEVAELEKAKHLPQICLELYKKPTDFTKKNLNLFTIKQLYLHLAVVFNQH